MTSADENNEVRPEWGSRAWFEERFADEGINPASYYGHALSGYQRYRHAFITTIIERHLWHFHPSLILDVGSALGDLGSLIGNLYPNAQVVGFDFATSVVTTAAMLNPESSFLVATLPQLPFKKGMFDLVLLSEVLYYLESLDRIKAIQAICETMKPGGKLLFTSALDNGERYFCRSGALGLLSAHFRVDSVLYGHNRAYQCIERLLVRLVALSAWYQDGSKMPTRKYAHLCKRLTTLRNIPLVRVGVAALLACTSKLSQWLLSFEWLPYAMGWFSRGLFADRTVTNIFIIAAKRQESDGHHAGNYSNS